MTNVVEILITAKNLTGPAMASVNAEVTKAGGAMRTFHKTAALAGAGLAAIGYESVKMASKFDASMTLLHTQAGVAKDQMATLKKGVLDLAGKVGQDPDSLAESLFHVESNFESMGISSKKALSLVETAAKGATVGHADLVDVTNALTAAVASGIPGVQNFDKAMGVLNATVGVGDMKMQDLASAFGSGMVATVKGFGLSIQDVGAALAVFGDNNIRGSLAGNQLRMSVMALGKPVSTAKDALDKLGLTQTTLAEDMQKGGLKLALEDLVDRMHKAGISSKEQGQIITDAFGRKAGAGLNILVGQFDRLESKYPALAEGANKFGNAWKDTQKTFAYQTKALQGSFDALMISVGTKLIPPVQSFVNLLLAHKGAATAAVAGMAGLLTATVAVSAAMKTAAATTALYNGAVRGVAAVRGAFETAALKALYLRDAFVAAGGGAKGLRAAFASLNTATKSAVVLTVLAGIALAVYKLSNSSKEARVSVDDLARSITTGLAKGHISSSVLDDLRKAQQGLVKDTDDTASAWDRFTYSFTHFGAKWTASATSSKAAANDFRDLGNAIGQIAQNKGVDTASQALALLAKQGVHIPTKYLKDYNNATADAAVESKLTAASMGLFGDAAVSTQKSLDAEAQSAKGLEDSIIALNAVHRGAFDAETAFYQAISDATKAVKENGKTLDVHTEGGRKNRQVLSDLATKTEDLVDKKVKEKAAWSEVDKIYAQGRKNLINTAMAMGDTKKQAEQLANELLKAPAAKKYQIQVEDKAAKQDLTAFNAAVKKTPGAKSVTLNTLSKPAERVLESFGFKVTHLKNGQVVITTAAGGALSTIANVNDAISRLDGRVARTTIETVNYTIYRTKGKSLHDTVGATGGLYTGKAFRYAGGGLVSGPGSGTSDDVFAPWLSNGEFVMKKAAVDRYGEKFMQLLNAGRLDMPHFASGGRVTSAERAARNQIRGSFGISSFGRMAGYSRTPFEKSLGAPSDVSSLVSALNTVAGQIRAAFSGRTESGLLHQLSNVGKSLIRYDRSLLKVTASLDKAKSKLDDLKSSAAQLADSVKGGILSAANITSGASSGGTVTVAGIMSGLTDSRDKSTAFAGALAGLKSKGLRGDLIQQIAEAGISGGGLETAGALLSASSSELSSVNSLQAQIAHAAGLAGKSTADAVYAASIKAQEKLVNSLKSQQAKLEKAMANLAKVMERALQRAVGKKASGGIVGMAASGGARGGLTWVGEQGAELLDLPVGSRVWSGPDSRRRAAAMAAGPARIELEFRSSGSEVDELLVRLLRRFVRVRGGNVQVALMGR